MVIKFSAGDTHYPEEMAMTANSCAGYTRMAMEKKRGLKLYACFLGYSRIYLDGLTGMPLTLTS